VKRIFKNLPFNEARLFLYKIEICVKRGGPHTDPLEMTFIDPIYTRLTDENQSLPDKIGEQGSK